MWHYGLVAEQDPCSGSAVDRITARFQPGNRSRAHRVAGLGQPNQSIRFVFTGGIVMSSKRMFMIAWPLAVGSTSIACGASLAADGAKTKKNDTEAAAKAPAAVAETAKAPTAVAEPKEAEKAPRLTIVDPVKDFAVVPMGQNLDWSFVIKTTGNAALQT